MRLKLWRRLKEPRNGQDGALEDELLPPEKAQRHCLLRFLDDMRARRKDGAERKRVVLPHTVTNSPRSKLTPLFPQQRAPVNANDVTPVPTQTQPPKQDDGQLSPATKEGAGEPPEQSSPTTDAPTPPADDMAAPEPRRLTDEELHELFSGAPQFCVDRQQGRRQPRAGYPWDFALGIRDSRDSRPLSHLAFSAATLRQHLPSPGQEVERENGKVTYDIGVAEVPNMLSAQGIEPGTVGFEAFLQMPIADHLKTAEDAEGDTNGLSEAKRNLELLDSNPEKLGIRNVDMALVHERLAELTELYETFRESEKNLTILDMYTPGDLYANLFGKFLSPPRYDPDTVDPTGLKVQIETLMKVLRLKGIWHDFSLVEWRIRIGQILWASDAVSSEEDIPTMSGIVGGWSEKDILLTQILLASELLLRLEAVASLTTEEVKQDLHLTAAEVRNFRALRNCKIDWDLVAARRFLQNIHVVQEKEEREPSTPKKRGFLSAILRKPEEEEEEELEPSSFSKVLFIPRKQNRQLSGLIHFAEAIAWPNASLVKEDLTNKLDPQRQAAQKAKEDEQAREDIMVPESPATPSVYGTPLATSSGGMKHGYFTPTRPPLSRSSTAQRSLHLQPSTPGLPNPSRPDAASASISIGGWLSRTYFTGFILPGEALSHFLISTLLENDKLAIALLGESASLYGGFVYGGSSWWSKACVVGRVMACVDGAKECMGWIFVPRIPKSHGVVWVDIKTTPAPEHSRKHRIEDNGALARDSAVVPKDQKAGALASELTLPIEEPPASSSPVRFIRFTLKPVPDPDGDEPVQRTPDLDNPTDQSSGAESGDETDADGTIESAEAPVPQQTASLTFETTSTPTTSITLQLSHDVYFIASYPCHLPSNKQIRLLLPHNESTGDVMQASPPPPSPLRSTAPLPSHPLHQSYTYTTVPLATILDPQTSQSLARPDLETNPHPTPSADGDAHAHEDEVQDEDDRTNRFERPSSADPSSPPPPPSPPPRRVLVIDARGTGWEGELLARAWCAHWGVHAVIAKAERTCVSCAVREVKGLGWVVVVVRV